MAEEPRDASPWQAAKAVFWSFLGIRRRAHHEQDMVKLKPAQVIIAGIVGALIFIAVIATIAGYVVRHAA